jgi:biotin transport system substrate-specific component
MNLPKQNATSTQASQVAQLLSTPETIPGRIFLAIGASVLVALCAHGSLPLPFTPVPLTLSDLAVLTIGLTLGPVTAFSAMMLYLLEGACGLPVFSPVGPGGVAQLLGTSGGFLLAYPLVAATAGLVAKYASRLTTRFAAGVIGAACASIVLFAAGAGWLASFPHMNLDRAIHLAVLPFVFGNLAKIVAAAAIFSGLQRWRQSA